jgi:hypothetical protein
MARLALVASVALGLSAPETVSAQERCRVLCAPQLKIEPTFTIEKLFQVPRILTITGGDMAAIEQEEREGVFELIFALDVPTQLPRLGLTFEASFKPFLTTDSNPFTGMSTDDLSGDIRDNPVEIESELNLYVLTEEQTGGWVSSHVDIVDQFSPAKQPDDAGVYTHKLDFEWDTAFHVFKRFPETNWLHHVEAEVSLDYLATGLPRAGDTFGSERFLDRASPWSFSFVLVMPLAPLTP